MRLLLSACFATCFFACVQTTGSSLVTFSTFVAGPETAATPLVMVNQRGYSVTIDSATLVIGAIYLNRTLPNWANQREGCTNPGLYVAQAFGPVEANLLSPEPQKLLGRTEGVADEARAAELWLGSADANAEDSSEVVARFSGTAEKTAAVYPFVGQITLGKNRAVAAVSAARPGANPPCFLRILAPFPVSITPAQDGTLLLRVDPRSWFQDVEFAELTASASDPTRFEFIDATSGAPQLALFSGFRALKGTFELTWTNP